MRYEKQVSWLNHPQSQLRSPLIKKKFKKINMHPVQEYGNMQQWYKTMINEVKIINISNGIICSSRFMNYLDIACVNQSYQKVMKIVHKIQIKKKEKMMKLFFSILHHFLEKERQKSNHKV